MTTIQQYHADTTHASKSALDIISRSPFEYAAKKFSPEVLADIGIVVPDRIRQQWAEENEKRHFVIGDALDRWLLEQDIFFLDFYVGTAHSRATKEGKAQAAKLFRENPGKRWISPGEFEEVKLMAKSLRSQWFASLIDPARAQQTITWIDERTGIPCKCRPDWIIGIEDPDWAVRAFGQEVDEIVFDLKSIDSLDKWAKHVADFRYDVQNAFYLDGINAALPGPKRAFAFMVVSREWPHPAMIRVLPPAAVQVGRIKYRDDLATLKSCRETGHWPMAAGHWGSTDLPGWYKWQHKEVFDNYGDF